MIGAMTICPRTKSLRCSVPWTMRPLDDASRGWCVPWMMRPLDDASLGRCVPWMMRPVDDASLGRYVPWTSRSWPWTAWKYLSVWVRSCLYSLHSSCTGRIVQGTHCRREALPRDRHPRHSFGDTSVGDAIKNCTEWVHNFCHKAIV